MNKTMLSLLAVMLVSLSVASASLWSVGVSEVQVIKGSDREWRSVSEPLLYGQDFIKNLATGKTYQFFEIQPSRDYLGRPFSSGGQVYYSFNGVTKQGYFNILSDEAVPKPLEPPKAKVITQEFSRWPTGKTFQNGIPGYYTGRDAKVPEPYLFSEKPMKVEEPTSNEVVMINMGGGGGGPGVPLPVLIPVADDGTPTNE